MYKVIESVQLENFAITGPIRNHDISKSYFHYYK
jgi:hypothetical protein